MAAPSSCCRLSRACRCTTPSCANRTISASRAARSAAASAFSACRWVSSPCCRTARCRRRVSTSCRRAFPSAVSRAVSASCAARSSAASACNACRWASQPSCSTPICWRRLSASCCPSATCCRSAATSASSCCWRAAARRSGSCSHTRLGAAHWVFTGRRSAGWKPLASSHSANRWAAAGPSGGSTGVPRGVQQKAPITSTTRLTPATIGSGCLLCSHTRPPPAATRAARAGSRLAQLWIRLSRRTTGRSSRSRRRRLGARGSSASGAANPSKRGSL